MSLQPGTADLAIQLRAFCETGHDFANYISPGTYAAIERIGGEIERDPSPVRRQTRARSESSPLEPSTRFPEAWIHTKATFRAALRRFEHLLGIEPTPSESSGSGFNRPSNSKASSSFTPEVTPETPVETPPVENPIENHPLPVENPVENLIENIPNLPNLPNPVENRTNMSGFGARGSGNQNPAPGIMPQMNANDQQAIASIVANIIYQLQQNNVAAAALQQEPHQNQNQNNYIRAEEVGVFDPDPKDIEVNGSGIVSVGKLMVYTDVYTFTNRIREIVNKKGDQVVQEN